MMSTQRAYKNRDKSSKNNQNAKMEAHTKTQLQDSAERSFDKHVPDVDPALQKIINQVIELTQRPTDEVLVALHDCDNDATQAINMLLEGGSGQGEWLEQGKKKKKHPGAPTKSNETVPDNKSNNIDKPRRDDNRRDGPPRRGRQPPRFDKQKREHEENEKNRSESQSQDRSFGRGRGSGRGRGRGRGGRGGRFDRSQGQDRYPQDASSAPQIGTWTNETAEKAQNNTFTHVEEWDGVDEWTGSLDDTKVFSAKSDHNKMFAPGTGDNDASMFSVPPPSVSNTETPSGVVDDAIFNSNMANMMSSSAGSNTLEGTLTQSGSTLGQRLDLGLLLGKTTDSSTPNAQLSYNDIYNKEATESLRNAVGIGAAAGIGGSNALAGPGGMGVSSGIGSSSATSVQRAQSPTMVQPQRQRPQKSKLPPPSKIPESAVEMPAGKVQALDVQFGSWDAPNDVGFSFGVDTGVSNGPAAGYNSNARGVNTSLSNHLPHVNTDSAPTGTTLSTSSKPVNSIGNLQPQKPTLDSAGHGVFQPSQTPPAKDYSQSSLPGKIASPPEPIPYPSDRKPANQYNSQRSTGASHTSNKPPMGFSASSNYNSSGYGNQKNAGNSLPNQYNNYHDTTSSSLYTSQHSGTANSYSNQTFHSSRESNQTANSQSYTTGSNAAGSSYQASVSQPGSSYQSNTSQSAGNYARDSQGSSYTSYSAAHPNNLQNSGSKLSESLSQMGIKDSTSMDKRASSQYESSVTSTVGLTTTTSTTASSLASGNVSVTTGLGLSSSSTISTSVPANSTASGAKLGNHQTTSKAPPNLPPGVAPMMTNYMIGQPGMPFAFPGLAQGIQPPIYSYDDLQFLQQRVPIPPTTLTGREGGLSNVPPYTGTENKMNRVDAQSPVQGSQSSGQQQQTVPAQTSQQQALFNPAAMQPQYNYYYQAAGMLPQGYQYGHQVYPVPPVTNTAHTGTTANSPFQKPATYAGSHSYGTAAGYDDLGSHNPDYSKTYGGAGAAAAQTPKQAAVTGVSVTSSGGVSDLYGKAHTQAFDKTFATGTPPPYNMLPSGSQAAGPLGAAAAYGTPYMPMLAPHQQHSQMLSNHHLTQQDASGVSSRTSQPTATKAVPAKTYGGYWAGNN